MGKQKNRFQGTQNDIDGERYQIIVRDYLEEFTGVSGISKVNHGIDVEVEKYKIEVKGMRSLFFVAGVSFRYSAWKFYIPYLKEELTHFCFLLEEKRINPEPLLYFIPIQIIKDYIHKWKAINNRSEWIRFPIYWVLENYDKELSRISSRMDKKDLQNIVDDMKNSLQEYWTNEVKLPLSIQLHSMALMDIFIENLELSKQLK